MIKYISSVSLWSCCIFTPSLSVWGLSFLWAAQLGQVRRGEVFTEMFLWVCTGASGHVLMVTELSHSMTLASFLHECVSVCVWPIVPVGCFISCQRGLHYHPNSLMVIGQVSSHRWFYHSKEQRGEGEQIKQDNIKTTDQQTERYNEYMGQTGENTDG